MKPFLFSHFIFYQAYKWCNKYISNFHYVFFCFCFLVKAINLKCKAIGNAKNTVEQKIYFVSFFYFYFNFSCFVLSSQKKWRQFSQFSDYHFFSLSLFSFIKYSVFCFSLPHILVPFYFVYSVKRLLAFFRSRRLIDSII